MFKRSVAITGTREGGKYPQLKMLRHILDTTKSVTMRNDLHHGCCVGFDVEADKIARELGYHMCLHPSDHKSTRVHCTQEGDTLFPVKPPLVRDRDMVDVCPTLIAGPKGYAEELRSGTWTTVRYARKMQRRIIIIWPDGTVREEP